MSTSDIITLSVALLSLVLSGFAAYKAYNLGNHQLRVVNRIEYQKLLFDIDKQLMQDPALWAIYDNHPLSAQKKDDPTEKGKREAFLHYHANLLELVYVFFCDARWLTADEKLVANAWDGWTKYLIANSSEFRTLLSRADLKESFNAKFVSNIEKLLAAYRASTPGTGNQAT